MSALTACNSLRAVEPIVDNKPVLMNMVPEHPELPEWPKLNWEAGDGKQSISNEDALKIIDYWENKIPQYNYEVEKYKKSIAAIMDAM